MRLHKIPAGAAAAAFGFALAIGSAKAQETIAGAGGKAEVLEG